jgi:hypothetical protein
VTLIGSDGPDTSDESVELTDARISESFLNLVPRPIQAKYVAGGREYSDIPIAKRLC